MEKIITHSAINYAHALFETGKNYGNDLISVNEVLTSSEELKNIINNPAIDLNAKYKILDEIFQNKIDEKVIEFIKILTEKNRINELDQILASYNAKVDEFNNIKNVEITSAIELNDEIKNKILAKLTEKLNKTINPRWIVNNEIISGLVFKIEDNIVDTSLLTKIESIGKNIR